MKKNLPSTVVSLIERVLDFRSSSDRSGRGANTANSRSARGSAGRGRGSQGRSVSRFCAWEATLSAVRYVHMKRTDHTQDVPNFAGVSLALYLLVSILSMMAAYDVGKASDDVRNSVVISNHSSYGSPNKSGDDGRSDGVIVLALERVALDTMPQRVSASVTVLHIALLARAFNARAPPVPVPLIV